MGIFLCPWSSMQSFWIRFSLVPRSKCAVSIVALLLRNRHLRFESYWEKFPRIFWCGYTIPLEPILSKTTDNIHKRFPLRLRASVRSTELLLKQKCGRTLCTPHNLQKRSGVQKCKCGTRAKFCEMQGVWGNVFRKIRFACSLIFLAGFWRSGQLGKN